MSCVLFATLVTLSLVAGEVDQRFISLIQQVNSQGQQIHSHAQQWSPEQGLQSALSLQQDFEPFNSQIDELNSAAGQLAPGSPSDTNEYLNHLSGLSSNIVSLLDTLTEKSGEFQSVGAQQAVGEDVSKLASPAVSVQSALIQKLPSDAPFSAVSSASNVFSSLQHAFQEAGTAYSVSVPVDAPVVPTGCSARSSEGGAAGAGAGTGAGASAGAGAGSNANTGAIRDPSSNVHEKQSQGQESSVENAESTTSGEPTASSEPTASGEHHSHHSNSGEHEKTHTGEHHETATTDNHAAESTETSSHHTKAHSSHHHHNSTESHKHSHTHSHTHSAKHSKNQTAPVLSGISAGVIGILAFLV